MLKMLNISELHRETIILDATALFLLAGLFIYTKLYRRRGHFDDKVFFAMLMTTFIMAIADGITYVVDGSTLRYSALISMIFNNVFFITFELFAGLLALYMVIRLKRGEEMTNLGSFIVMMPAFITIGAVIVNNFVTLLYYIDANNEYVYGSLYNIVFVAPAFYAVIVLAAIIRIDYRVTWIYLVLLAMRIFLGSILRGVSSTPLIFAMGLIFIHIHVMGQPFYEEERQ